MMWDRLRRVDKRKDKSRMLRVIKAAREDEFWSKNFLTPMKLRDKNRDGVMYIDVFIERFGDQAEAAVANVPNWRDFSEDEINHFYLNHKMQAGVTETDSFDSAMRKIEINLRNGGKLRWMPSAHSA